MNIETDPLLDTDTLASESTLSDHEDRFRDRPIQVDAFNRNVVACKSLFGVLMLLHVGLDTLGQVQRSAADQEQTEFWFEIASTVTVSFLLPYLAFTLIRPIRVPHLCRFLEDIPNLPLHAHFTLLAFFGALIVVGIDLVPCFEGIWALRQGIARSIFPSTLALAKVGIASAACIAVGSMRRGPKLRYEEIKLGTGFGVSATVPSNEDAAEAKGRAEECNVIDWYGSPILGILTLWQNYRLARRSTQVEQLQPSDVPHFEERVRMAGVAPPRFPERWSEDGQKLDVTGSQVIRTLWRGRLRALLTCLLLQAIATLFGFTQIVATYELIRSFDTHAKDKTYPYFLCGFLFLGQACRTMASAVSWAMEKYCLNEPIRMSICSMLFQKILRTADVKSLDAHHLSDADREKNKGRAQVLNLLMHDSEKISALAARLWSITNAIISLTIGGAMLWNLLGVSALVGVAFIPALAPLSIWVSRKIYHIDKIWIRTRDARIAAFKEFLNSIKPIKVKEALGTIPDVIQGFLEVSVSLDRLVAFWNQPEIDLREVSIADQPTFQNATIAWPAGEEGQSKHAFLLREIDLALPKNGLSLISGPLGSGKTLLLHAMLNEAVVLSGQVRAPRSQSGSIPIASAVSNKAWTAETWLVDSVAYAPQQAYIRHGTIMDNILLGQPLWRERYDEVLRQASLLPDLAVFEEGDQTEVGEGGVTLSGGQKARINLACCIYSRARTIYLDDILSAVDSHTAQHIFEECLRGPLLKGRTVVLVTHHVNLCLPAADFIVTLDAGRVVRACAAIEFDTARLRVDVPASSLALPVVKTQNRSRTAISRQVYTTETRAIGRVDRNHYTLLLSTAGGTFFWGVLISSLFLVRYLEIYRRKILENWSADHDPANVDYYATAWTIWTLLSSTLGQARLVWLYGVGERGMINQSCRVVHDQVLERLCNAPLHFFDTTPTGRLLNVMGQDVSRIDADAANNVFNIAAQLTVTVASIGVVCYYQPMLLVVLCALAVPFLAANRFLRKLRADLHRVSLVAFSPLISFYNDSIDGAIMIRAFGLGDSMFETLIALTNNEKKNWTASWHSVQWAGFVLQTLASVVSMSMAIALLQMDISPSRAGFILSLAFTISSTMYVLLEQSLSIEQTFVSAERINSYIQMETQEPLGGVIPPVAWPDKGQIQIRDLRVRYAPDLPEVLHGVSVSIQPESRTALVGATGSGKSTLALSLFRGNEQTGGCIEIDGIGNFPLYFQSKWNRLNMIVQDSNLISGTLRDALDITGSKGDAEILHALRRVHLIDADESDNDTNPFCNLETFVAAQGSNFSQGQRQLLCLARALLKRAKILVMDEATSSVDFEMDAKITATIKECFHGNTMLVIAHRLATIMHFDQVVVLNSGRILEQGRPADLLADGDSAFYALCMAQGKAEFDKLSDMVKIT